MLLIQSQRFSWPIEVKLRVEFSGHVLNWGLAQLRFILSLIEVHYISKLPTNLSSYQGIALQRPISTLKRFCPRPEKLVLMPSILAMDFYPNVAHLRMLSKKRALFGLDLQHTLLMKWAIRLVQDAQ